MREIKISLRNSSGGPVYLHTLEGTLLTMECEWTFTKRFILSTLRYGNNHKNNALLAAIASYISITTIYTSGSQTLCRERISGVPWNVLEFLKIINSYYN